VSARILTVSCYAINEFLNLAAKQLLTQTEKRDLQRLVEDALLLGMVDTSSYEVEWTGLPYICN